MAKMKIWFDEEGDYLEIRSEEAKGYMRDLGNDIWERVDEQGKVIGSGILGFKKRSQGNNGEIRMPLTMSFS
jgi:uncharacterized protein YuzE